MKIEICIGTTCHLLGGSYLEEITREYKSIEEIKFKFVTCFGVCNGEIPAPVVRIDGKMFGDMNYAKMEELIKEFLAKEKSGGEYD